MTDELRGLLRADLAAERPPPIGDVVGAAIREGRRLRRNRRLGASAVLVVAVAAAALLLGDGSVAERSEASVPVGAGPSSVPPGSVPVRRSAPTAPPQARTLTVHSGTLRAEGMQKKATSAAMLHLLTQLLPPGRTSHFAVAADNDLLVQLYLDDGDGPAMVRVSIGRAAPFGDEPPRGTAATVTIEHLPDNCVQDTVVGAEWPDGTLVQVDVATCLAWDGVQNRPTRPSLTTDEAIRVAADPRWGVAMDADLIDVGAKRFAGLPEFS
ncbi:hypothetical protein ACWKSP_30765 [Micromonosporaceae bacterium Da 78-11]